MLSAQDVRLAHANQQKQPPPTQPSDSPPKTTQHAKIRKVIMATRTLATSEDRDSEVRQRCGCKIISSYAENCSTPNSRRHVEDVHSVGVAAASHYAKHETCARNRKPTSAHSTIRFPDQHNTTREDTKSHHGNTYSGHQRRSRLRGSAAMWLQVLLELR